MSQEAQAVKSGTMPTQSPQPGEQGMVSKERWETIRRLHWEEHLSLSEIARRLDLDRGTVAHWARQSQWKPYERAARNDTLLAPHEQFVRERAPQVDYSARIVFQELKHRHGFAGSYETVKRALAPLRQVAGAGEGCITRFETEPGQQSQIDWGQVSAWFRERLVVLHLFVLTLGFSRRGFYYACANEQMAQFLEAHERGFEHFGGLTREHLYDRPRTVCQPGEDGKRVWNPTFKSFADYWGFEPRVCRAYRAQTKGKVESGVKYVKRNFLPGRHFVDIVDFQAQLDEWNASIADQRVHGTTHEQPIVRFERERATLIPLAGQPGFKLAARVSRIVPADWLVSFQTNRYSVPFQLIGQTVEVQRQGEQIVIFHRDQPVARHGLLAGKHQVHIVPEHSPGAIARNARQRRSHAPHAGPLTSPHPEVEVRDLHVYEQLIGEQLAQEVMQ
jgi:transposase